MPVRKTITLLALAGLITLAGCHKQKPPIPPAQQQAPTITQPAPQQPAPAQTTSTTTETKPKTPASTTTSASTAPKTKPHAGRPKQPSTTARKASPKSSEPTQQASAKPSPQIPNSQPSAPATPPVPLQQPQPIPGTAQIVPGLPHDEAMHSRFTTEQLLLSTDQNLAGLRRALSPSEQDMVAQIRLFMQQSRAAIGEGDLVRARNLALKAHLLSDDLVQR